ncbi:uncharacterized protein LOC127284028 [Leptopilina boulardi]|uniref:uncharacterized protein LOC127284028 n=1 Tax=Leptopilina boulardi TaxID=63433 RepID=UPI0021F50C38|nr:uncharacterized protein LOC127284028 [Leptopilina boulardi]
MPGPIAKPVMRGMHIAYVTKGIYAGIAVALLSGFTFKHFVMDARRKTYDEFYATYDAKAACERLNKTGYMRSSPENLAKRN